MAELLFIKLGGSLITDKTRPYTARFDKLAQLAGEIHTALQKKNGLPIVLGHGSGSFGHFAVKEHWSPLTAGSQPNGQRFWQGFSEVWYRASQLNRHVIEACRKAGLQVVSFPASASVRAEDGRIVQWDISPLKNALENGLIPVIYGDVVFDSHLGGVVLSTEVLMAYLAMQLKPGRILLAGLETAVWQDFPERRQKVDNLTPATYRTMAGRVGGSHGMDVTGGMKSKVEQMLELVSQAPEVSVQIFSGEGSGNVEKAISGAHLGTLITCD